MSESRSDSDALHFEAPYLIHKLIKEGIADSVEEANALFTEVKRYLVLGRHHPQVTFPMFSTRVDATWHDFVLFTAEYAEFCQRFFGIFLHHVPNESPRTDASPRPVASFDEFSTAYETLFREKVPDLWRDHTSMALHRRLVNDSIGRLHLKVIGDDAMLFDTRDVCLMTVNAIAVEALQFIMATPHFHVRELPGDLTTEEKLGLGEILVEHKILRVA